ncbi:hypothetical protein BpHYR1_032997, partial [Brachionus plicatilis]
KKSGTKELDSSVKSSSEDEFSSIDSGSRIAIIFPTLYFVMLVEICNYSTATKNCLITKFTGFYIF